MRLVMDQHGASLRRGERDGQTPALAIGAEEAPFLAVVEARGALLLWDVRHASLHPDAVVSAPEEAGSWLEEIYGSEIAAAIRAPGSERSDDSFGFASLRRPGPTLRALKSLAWLAWARAWWPAGRRVPPLSRALLGAEYAVTTASLSHLLDDDSATERALSEAAWAAPALRRLVHNEALGTAASALLDRFEALTEDFGAGLSEPRTDPSPGTDPAGRAASDGHDDWDRSAGDTLPIEIPVSSGEASVDPGGVGPGALDPEALAVWEIIAFGPAMRLRVATTAAPAARFPLPEPRLGAELVARYGPDELGVEVPLVLAGRSYSGEVDLPPAALLLNPADRVVRIGDRRYPHDPVVASDPAAPGAGVAGLGTRGAPPLEPLIAIASDRLRRAAAGDPAVTLAERAAAWAAIRDAGSRAATRNPTGVRG